MIKNIIILLLLTVVLMACQNDLNSQKNIGPDRQVEREANPIVVTTEETMEAIYLGQKDTNSVQLSINGKQITFQLDEMIDNEINALTKGDKVKITLLIKTEQVKDGEIKSTNLTKIEKVK